MYDVICSSLILTIQLALNYGSLGWGIRTLNIMEYINLSFPWIVREDALEQNWLKTLWFLVRSTRIHDVVICSSHILTTLNCAKLWLQPRLRDMDMNQHVNNVKYISWVLEVHMRRPLCSLELSKTTVKQCLQQFFLCDYMSAQTIVINEFLETLKSRETG